MPQKERGDGGPLVRLAPCKDAEGMALALLRASHPTRQQAQGLAKSRKLVGVSGMTPPDHDPARVAKFHIWLDPRATKRIGITLLWWTVFYITTRATGYDTDFLCGYVAAWAICTPLPLKETQP